MLPGELFPGNIVNNQWLRYIKDVFLRDFNTSGWKWKSENKEVQKMQLNFFSIIFMASRLPLERRVAIAGWMLSEMLKEVPKSIVCSECGGEINPNKATPRPCMICGCLYDDNGKIIRNEKGIKIYCIRGNEKNVDCPGL